MIQALPGAYGDLLYRGDELVVVRSIDKAVACPDWMADVAEFGHLMFLNIALDPETQKVYASGKANIGNAVVIVGPDNFQTVIPGGWPNYPSQLAVVEGRLVCYVVLSLTEFGMFDLSGQLLATLTIPPAYQGTSEGIRFVADDGTVMWGKQTEAGIFEGLIIREWMQRSGYTGGQGQDGGFALSGNGVSTLYPSGNTFFPRIAVHGDRLSLLYVNGGMVCWDTLTLPLEAIAPVPPIPAPKISNVQYDPLVKAGQPWRMSFDCVDTSFWVEFTEPPQRLRIHAVNDTGEDTTGVVRPITIEGPDTPEPPEPPIMPILGRFWYQPNIGSKDLLQVFDQLPQAGAFVLYIQEVLADQSGGQVGDNTYPNLVAAGAFAKLKANDTPLVIESGALKEFDCDGSKLREAMATAVRRVEDAGGIVSAFSMDEPLTGNTIDNAQGISCDLPLSACVDVMAAYIRLALSFGCLCGWLEAWPRIPLQTLKDALRQLNTRDALPHYLHVDINYHECEQQHISASQIAAFIHAIQEECNTYGVLFGVFVNSTEDPIATDQAHHTNLIALANRLHGIVPDVAHVHVAAWASRVPNGPQDVPNNFGQFGLLSTFDETCQIFDPIPVEPPEEIDPMLYKLIDPVSVGILRVKQLKPSQEAGKYVAIMEDGTVASVQPDGSMQYRPAGTDAPWEQCFLDEGRKALLYDPDKDIHWAYAYALVG